MSERLLAALANCREQIQDDLTCVLDPVEPQIVLHACQVVVDRFRALEAQFEAQTGPPAAAESEPGYSQADLGQLRQLAQDVIRDQTHRYSTEIEVDAALSVEDLSEGNDGIWVRAWVLVGNARLREVGWEVEHED